MAKQKPRRKGFVRFLRAAVLIILLAFLGLVGWMYLTPMLTADSITLYDSYAVEQGSIQTTLSFSATLDVKKSQTYMASDMCKVKELYVKSGDEVSEGEPLVLLTDGELFTADFDGVVNEIRVSVGDWVRPYFSVIQICDLVNLEATMSVDEYDVKALSLGQNCTIRVISLGMDFDATITHIDRVASTSGTLAYYTVTCDLPVPEEVLPGMRATVMIPDQSVESVNMLSLEALTFDDEEKAYVLLKNTSGGYDSQYVETGLSDGVNVEIKGGLNLGDTVYVVSGTESAKASFSLEDIYKSIVGEKVVINPVAGQMMGGAWNSDGTGMTAPDGSAMPDFGNIPAGGTAAVGTTTTDATTTDATTTDGSTMPTGFTPPDGATLPDRGTMPAGGTASGETGTAGTQTTQDTQAVQDVQDLLNTQNPQDTQTEQTAKPTVTP
jgi:multidrug efflux pump subunit AcrA (membrane-fusion protein)